MFGYPISIPVCKKNYTHSSLATHLYSTYDRSVYDWLCVSQNTRELTHMENQTNCRRRQFLRVMQKLFKNKSISRTEISELYFSKEDETICAFQAHDKEEKRPDSDTTIMYNYIISSIRLDDPTRDRIDHPCPWLFHFRYIPEIIFRRDKNKWPPQSLTDGLKLMLLSLNDILVEHFKSPSNPDNEWFFGPRRSRHIHIFLQLNR